ncbi:MAG: hypothetical protein ILP19_08140 [Oscillospiraceae bacterium]|nr:hypothetical protein [Oscillospiraceae bacterium]
MKRFFILILIFSLFMTSLALPVSADARREDISDRLEALSALHETVVSDHRTQRYTKWDEAAKLRVLIVKCSNVTMDTDGKEQSYAFSRGSDTDKVIDHAVIRFKQTIEDMTDHSVEILPSVVWVNDAMTLPAAGFGYEEVGKLSSVRIPVEDYDSVFFFSGRQVGYGTTGRNLILSDYGESCVFPLDVRAELSNIRQGISVEEEMKSPWTCGFMTHEFIHQIDLPSKAITGDERFPTCHQYQVDGKAGLEYLKQTKEGKDIYLTNPENGYKWKYVPGKYPDFIGDYYEAFFRGEIIDTRDGNKKKGMFPSLWHFLCSPVKLGTYTIRNISTKRYLCAADHSDRAGASALVTVKDPDLSSKNVRWEIVYDVTTKRKGCVRLVPVLDRTELIRAQKSPGYDTAALYRSEWGVIPTKNKNFAFEIKNVNGKYQIKTTLGVLDGCLLCDTGGGAELSSTNKNDTWELRETGK